MKTPAATSPSGVTLEELARLVGGEIRGVCEERLFGIAGIREARKGQITFLVNPKYGKDLETTRASAVIVGSQFPQTDKPLLITSNPFLAYARIAQFFAPQPSHPLGISSMTHCGEECRIGENVSIYPFVYLGNRVEVGDGVVLYPGVYLGDSVRIGKGSVVYPNVSILSGTIIGQRVVIHSGTVIGSDGFGFVQDGLTQVKIPQTGIVQIDDDCEIGANNTIDRATFGKTWIKAGVKTDNLVHVAHNVVVGENSLLIAQVGISGSVTIGQGVILAGQVGVADHIIIGDGVKVGGKSGVIQSIPPGEVVSGNPTMPHRTYLRVSSLNKRLPEMVQKIRALEERIRLLETEHNQERKEGHGTKSS
ncbi:MAG: UDP-3-O-(3-hydroxymyristoyl)glucosamine N-acyltransferase [Deltaproteobacteria bacterium]|nr:UDP-3-O-(3-hydroxymyristoyl)glucosamine N-acyltransferase [Deltaproteobacteria bacterium]